ncbi:alpha/beta fold hydrolase, partial [Legionella pneumophila]
MYRAKLSARFFIGLLVLLMFNTGNAQSLWLTLPPTPTLPNAEKSGYASVNGIKIWYAVFGQGQPLILLHGGL